VTAKAHRAPNARARTTPPSTGELHRTLEEARDQGELSRFCSAHVCTTFEVSKDGKRLHLPRVLQLMRDRGYQVSDPTPPQHQPKKGFTAWLVHIRTPGGIEFDMGFYTPNEPKQGSCKKSPTPHMEPA
jgi:hypothetical protein